MIYPYIVILDSHLKNKIELYVVSKDTNKGRNCKRNNVSDYIKIFKFLHITI